MIRSVNPYPISSYFNPDESQSFFIPKYQREYVWKKENWEALFNDLQDADPGHFLGSIICVNAQEDGMAGSRLELIDGQQRFTTVTLLLCALYKKLSDCPEKDEELQVELVNLRNRIFVKGTKQWRFEPSEQAQNKADIQNVLSELFPKLVPPPKGLRYFGIRRIAKAYWYFNERLNDLKIDLAQELLEKVKAAVLVKIEVPSHSDAFVLFETINNRGIPLSAIDIIKNNLLAELDKDLDYGIDRAFEEWKELIDLLPDAAVQERFLRQLYNVFRYLRRVEVKGCPRATRSNLIRIYDTLIRRHPALLFRELQVRGRTYATLLNPEAATAEWGANTAMALEDLQRLGAAPAYAFLLWSSHVSRARKWDEAVVLQELTTFLTKWFFWRNLTDVPPTRELDQMFIDMIAGLLARLRTGAIGDHHEFIHATREALIPRAATQDACDMKLRGDVYVDNYDATKFMLCKLEEAHQTRENKVDLWSTDSSNRPVFTVEHVLPKTENLGVAWVQMLQTGSVETADIIRQRCAHQIGNLTLSGYNARLGTMAFARKRDRRNDKDDLIGYKNGLYLNTDLAKRDDWNEEAIQYRTEVMLKEMKIILGLWGRE